MMDTSRFLDGYSAFGHIRRVIRQKYGSQRNFARSLGISEQHLSDQLNGRGNISDVVMLACGLRPRVVYEVMPGSETVDEYGLQNARLLVCFDGDGKGIRSSNQ